MEEGAITGKGSSTPAPPVERSLQVRYYYKKRTPQAGQVLPAADAIPGHAAPCSELFETGGFYEIDHEKLPPKSPIQLKTVRVVMVSEATRLDVTVNFPSALSLRSYFSGDSDSGGPEMDERFVMGCKQAGKILRRMVPQSELEQEKELHRFWVVEPKISETPPVLTWTAKVEEDEEMPSGDCLRALKTAGQVEWGLRRKVKYVGRQRDMQMQLWFPDTQVDEGESGNAEQEQQIGRKRSRNASKKKERKRSERRDRKRVRVKREVEEVAKPRVSRPRGSHDRWSVERYSAAEKKLLEIMREMRAELGSPVMRMELRDEARKHIGDTGLLDHLLKHMAGKIVADGAERFRRRHNAEGAMEYWLEPADLAENRRKAGVADPYWIPPPGWKPGDAVYACSCGAELKDELNRFREEVAGVSELRETVSTLKSEMEKRAAAVQEEERAVEACDRYGALQEEHLKLVEKCCRMESEMANMLRCMQELKEDYQNLLQAKTKKEAEMELCMQTLKEEIRLIKTEMKTNDDEETANLTTAKLDRATHHEVGEKATTNNGPRAISKNQSSTTSNQTLVITSNNNNASAERRSGFRLCKPQGTFLWPNMASNGAANICITSSGSQVLPVVPTGTGFRDSGVPTPPSASSATSAPRLMMLPGPASPVLPRSTAAAEVVGVPAFRSASMQNVICPSIYCHSPRASAMTVLGRAGGAGEGRKKEAGWSNVTTDLALATPSPSYR